MKTFCNPSPLLTWHHPRTTIIGIVFIFSHHYINIYHYINILDISTWAKELVLATRDLLSPSSERPSIESPMMLAEEKVVIYYVDMKNIRVYTV